MNEQKKLVALVGLSMAAVLSPGCAEDAETPTQTEVSDVQVPDSGAGTEGSEPADGEQNETEQPAAPTPPADNDETFTVSGVARRTATLGPGEDGIGTLCVAITLSCPSSSNLNPVRIGPGAELKDADMSENEAEVPYSIVVDRSEAEQNTRYYVSAFLRENGADCVPAPGEPTVRAGDLVGTACGTFRYEGTDAQDVDMVLDWALTSDI